MESKKILHNKQGCYKIKKANGYEMGDNNMFQKFYPAEDIGSTYDINFEEYFDKGYRGVIFDVDNTLVRHNMPADRRAKQLFRRLKEIGFEFCFTSNNKEPRVKKFCEDVGGTHYIYKANKPSVKGYEKAMKMMGTRRENTLFVGDQLFTARGNPQYSCTADSSKGRNTDCDQEIF